MNEQFQPGDPVWYYRTDYGERIEQRYPAVIIGPAKPTRSGWTRSIIALQLDWTQRNWTRRKRLAVTNYSLTHRDEEVKP